MKIFILYKKEDYDNVKEFAELFSRENNFEVEYKPVAVGKFYHDLLKYIFQSDILIFFWSSESIKSKWFKIIANKFISSKSHCVSVIHDITDSELSVLDYNFSSIPTFSTFKLLKHFSEIEDGLAFHSIKRVLLYCMLTNRKPENVKTKKPDDFIVRPLFDLLDNFNVDDLKTECPVDWIKGSDIVNFAVFAPQQIRIGSTFVIDIWAYLEDQYDTVLKKAEEIKRDKIIGRQDSVVIKRESVLTVRLELDSLNVKTKFNQIYWNGKPANTSFLVEVHENAKIGDHFGTAEITFQGICIATIIFTINVSESKSDVHYQDTTAKINKYKSAFASYASKDGSEVYSRVHGMTKIAPDLDIFLARLSFKSKERWEEALMEHVPNKDVFYLFWSRNAIASAWVDKEWRLALKERDLSYIDPVPLESPRLATPPPELSTLHFDDIWIALKHENDFINTYQR